MKIFECYSISGEGAYIVTDNDKLYKLWIMNGKVREFRLEGSINTNWSTTARLLSYPPKWLLFTVINQLKKIKPLQHDTIKN